MDKRRTLGAVQDITEKRSALSAGTQTTAKSMSAADNMTSYVQIAQARADDTKTLVQAFKALCNALTAQQKQTINMLFRQDAAKTASSRPGHP